MSPRIASQSYGKSRVRLTKVTRHPDRHDLAELAVDILLEGAFEPSYTSGDNTAVIATDTMKNTVYALAASHPLDSPESFAAALADHFVTGKEQVTAATVEIEEAAWERIVDRSGSPHRHAFVAAGGGRRTCRVRQDQATVVVEAGIAGLAVVKTTDSAFRDFHRDDFTTLADTDDRIFGTVIEARWRYEPGLAGGLPASDFNAAYAAVRGQLVEDLQIVERPHDPVDTGDLRLDAGQLGRDAPGPDRVVPQPRGGGVRRELGVPLAGLVDAEHVGQRGQAAAEARDVGGVARHARRLLAGLPRPGPDRD